MNIYSWELQKNIEAILYSWSFSFHGVLSLWGYFNVSFADLVAHFKPINFLLKKKKKTLPVCLYIHFPDKDSHKIASNLVNPLLETQQN